LIKNETLATNLDFAGDLENPTMAVVGNHQRIALVLRAP
jgi:hypothetical protein